ADRPRDRGGELEAAEAFGAGSMEAHRVRRPAPRDEQIALGADGAELAAELEHERIHPVVVDEHVRPEADHLDRHVPVARPPQRVQKLVRRLRAGEEPRGASGTDRRVPREADVLLDHGRSMPTARSTSPAPRTRSTSPGRLRRASRAAPCSTVGAHPARTPASDSASTISLPLTPGTGCSRAG